MKDELHNNYGTVTGTPTLVAGAIAADSDQALQFNGTTNSMSVPDSVSDSLVVSPSGAGGMALETFLKFAALPGSTKTVIGKTGSYVLEINSTGHLLWTLTGSGSVTVTSTAALATGSYYHVVGVYNGDYTGTPIFGNQVQGSTQMVIPGDKFIGSDTGDQNLHVSQHTILEKGQLNSIVMDLQRDSADSTLSEKIKAVVYSDNAGVPDRLLGESAEQNLNWFGQFVGGVWVNQPRFWITFPVSIAVPAGPVWLGFIGGDASHQFRIGCETSGGSHAWRAAPFDSTPDTFGVAAGSNATEFSIYANYTPTGRTGAEGKALIYLNGVLDNSTSFTGGIADSANAISFAPSVAVTIDDTSIWNKKLTPMQVATHYAASIASNPTGFPSGPSSGGTITPAAGLFTAPDLFTSPTLVTA